MMKNIGTAASPQSGKTPWPSCTALILGVLASSNALAQSADTKSKVDVYGIIDVLVGPTTNITKDKGTVWRVSSGGENVSRLGFRGSEEIADGLKAVYQLEMGIAIDTGTPDNPLFKRQSNVGLEGRFGRVVVGRSFTSVYDFMLPYDPMGYAPFYSWAPTGNASGASKYGMTTGFDNIIKYTGKIGDLTFGANYGAGEQSGSTGDGAKGAVTANYVMGPFSVVGTYERENGTKVATSARDVTDVAHVGAMYNQGKWKVQAAARDFKLRAAKAGTPDVRARLYWAGVSYLIQQNLTLTGAAYYQDVRKVAASLDSDPVMYVGRVRYALGKRTDLYALAAYARAKHNQLVSLSRDEAGFDSNQKNVSVGIQVRF